MVRERLPYAINSAQAPFERARRVTWRFEFDGRSHRYFAHRFHRTWETERSVEIPLAQEALRGASRVLEVGNVLRKYGVEAPIHDVVDKFEIAAGVQNIDVVDLRPTALYDVAVSISTLEHVGFDEPEQDPEKVEAAVAVLEQAAERLLLTFPFGYNPHLDDLVRAGRFPGARFLRRISRDNRWEQATLGQIEHSSYGVPFPYANALVVDSRRTTA